MSTPLLPTTEVVSQAWLKLVVPAVHVDDELPKLADHPALATVGAIRTSGSGGGPGRDVPMHEPVVTAECWVAVAGSTPRKARNRAGQLAQRLVVATYDPALMGVVLDLPGDFGKARVHTVIALSDPDRIDAESGWGRYDVDLQFTWTAE